MAGPDRGRPRLLLVDNHDSFTWNLAELLVAVTGARPVVVANDDPGFRLADLDGFDGVVLSPGPGSPSVARDVGWCVPVLAAAGDLPVLGVCLGHQLLATSSGGRVERAAEPVHGRAGPVTHTGAGLFAAVPQSFQAVRYHSLVVTDPGPELLVDAWAADGSVMALRHRALPRFGVQFHPESIRSEAGPALLAAFTALCVPRTRSGPPPARHRAVPAATTAAAGPTATGATAPVADPPAAPGRPLARELPLGPGWTPARAHGRWFADAGHSFCLGGAGAFGHRAGRSLTGAVSAGGAGWAAHVDRLAGEVVLTHGDGRVEVLRADGPQWLAATLAALAGDDGPAGHPGVVGVVGYEAAVARHFPPAHAGPDPDAVWLLADRVLELDHDRGVVRALALPVAGDGGAQAAARAWLASLDALGAPFAARPDDAESRPALVHAGPPAARHDEPAYLAKVAAAQEFLRAGESYEICLTNEWTVPVRGFDAAAVLARLAPASTPFAGLLRSGRFALVSSSPEAFLDVARTPDGTRHASCRPMKGTRPRDPDPALDARARDELAGDVKDLAENLMIVDLVRNDLATVCAPGSVDVADLFAVTTFADAHQMVSTVTGRLREDVGTVAAVCALLPGGSMTGAPKLRTLEILERLEEGPRGCYSGVFGVLGLDGTAELGMVIRTVVVQDDVLRYGTGGAVTVLSDPAAEYAETLAKSVPLQRVLALAERDRAT